METRRIWASAALTNYVRFPHVQQVACVQRETFIVRTGVTRREEVYLVTDLPPDQADPARLLALNRGHWQVEALHYVRDWSYDEDRCRARVGTTPRALAALRNFAIGVLRWYGYTNIAAALRDCAARPQRVLAMLAI